ncbi:protein-disulfide reductase DsbD family protein [Novosphingobium sp. KCTC 2891]|nr:protein-disulfide reductase DsbD domain-containing protein [Novosphingobium sp. KCTC 2891]MCW1382487.1 protein-disulfide reductase DsbD family protein [Novosphingobium sp. KCTC 2891]
MAAPASANHIRASLVAEAPAAPGGEVTLAILMQPDKGWHGYWLNPGDAGLGLTLDWTLPEGARAGTMLYPVPQTLLVQGLMNHVYEHDYAVLVPLTLPANARAGTTLPITAKAQWLACTESICVPEQAVLQGTVTVGQGPADARFERWRAALPAPLDRPGTFAVTPKGISLAIPFPASAGIDAPHFFIAGDGLVNYAAPQAFRRKGDVLVVDLPRAKVPSAEQPTVISGVLALGDNAGGIALVARAGAVPEGGTPVGAVAGFSAATLGLAVLGALLGGLVLNVMPCVFPILSLKALALARGNSHRAHVEGLAYTAGVVLACLALGGAMLALRAAGEQVGWAFQLQDPGIVALLLLLAAAITANFAGLFELPGLSIERGSGSMGAFGTGLLAAFVATPCTGPFMAAAMGAALVLPTWAALAVFAALGVGLALPFLLLGFVPALRRLLPKPGPWMERFRHFMALPMGLTVLALGWLAWRLGGTGYALAAAALALAAVAVLALAGRAQRGGRPAARFVAPALLALAAAAVIGAPHLAEARQGADAGLLNARPFSEAALAKAQRSGKPAFVYFTADWCLSCKVNEGVAIKREATRDAFRKAGVTVLVGDWTRRDPAITRFLTAQGAAGVPLYLWYPAGGGAPVKLPQVLTPETLPALAAGR